MSTPNTEKTVVTVVKKRLPTVAVKAVKTVTPHRNVVIAVEEIVIDADRAPARMKPDATVMIGTEIDGMTVDIGIVIGTETGIEIVETAIEGETEIVTVTEIDHDVMMTIMIADVEIATIGHLDVTAAVHVIVITMPRSQEVVETMAKEWSGCHRRSVEE